MYIKVWMHAAQDQYQGTPLLCLRVLDSCCFRKLLEHKSRQIVEAPRSCSCGPGRRAGRTPSFCQINLNFCNPSGGQLSFVNSHSTRPRKCGRIKEAPDHFFSVYEELMDDFQVIFWKTLLRSREVLNWNPLATFVLMFVSRLDIWIENLVTFCSPPRRQSFIALWIDNMLSISHKLWILGCAVLQLHR